jgi:hypothetical protein
LTHSQHATRGAPMKSASAPKPRVRRLLHHRLPLLLKQLFQSLLIGMSPLQK